MSQSLKDPKGQGPPSLEIARRPIVFEQRGRQSVKGRALRILAGRLYKGLRVDVGLTGQIGALGRRLCEWKWTGRNPISVERNRFAVALKNRKKIHRFSSFPSVCRHTASKEGSTE